MKIGMGVVGWGGGERRSDRYGSIHLADEPYDASAVCKAEVDLDAVTKLVGKRVRIRAVVIEARDSGHCGDEALKIMPSTPDVGEEIDLGVGVLGIDESWDANPVMTLKPGDGREVFWLDPRKLYRLHDQTVDLYIEETEDAFSPRPPFRTSSESVISTGEDDGSMQIKGRMPTKVAPPIENISIENFGDGMFGVTETAPKKGQQLRAKYDDADDS